MTATFSPRAQRFSRSDYKTLGLAALGGAYALLPLAFKALAALLLWRWRHSLELEKRP